MPAMEARRPKALELGLFLLLVAMPLAFTPFSSSPFGDPKLVLLVGGTLAVWLGGLPGDRRLRLAAGAWVAVTALASAFSVDRGVSLTASTSGEGGGLILVLCCAVLVVGGPSITPDLVERGRRWFVWSTAIIAAAGIISRVAPNALGTITPMLGAEGAPMGNQLFAAAICAAGLAAALGRCRPRSRDAAFVIVIAFGIAAFGERTSLLLPPIVVGFMLWRARPGVRAGLISATLALAPIAIWQVLHPVLPASREQAAVTQVLHSATDSGRSVVWRVSGRATMDRPLLGWGPGTTGSAYMATATADEVRRATRAWADAHDLFLETAVTSGLLGLFALLVLMGLLVPRALRAGPDRAWALGAAAALGAYSLVEPVGIVIPPLLFLFAGVAGGPPREIGARALGAARVAVGALLAASLAVSGTMLVASALEQWGQTYGEPWAYRAALRWEPWRISAAEGLAQREAIDGRSGNAAAAAEARQVIAQAVQEHPWNPGVRPSAVLVEVLLRNFPAAEAWARLQAARFPADASLPAAVRNQAANPAGVSPAVPSPSP